MNYRCRRESCHWNDNGKCTFNWDEDKEPPCDKDVFHCVKCEHYEWIKNPLDVKKCPNCRSTTWDIAEVTCNHCGYTWRPRSYKTRTCPKCSKELHKL